MLAPGPEVGLAGGFGNELIQGADRLLKELIGAWESVDLSTS